MTDTAARTASRLIVAAAILAAAPSLADETGLPEVERKVTGEPNMDAVYQDEGRFFTEDDVPTFFIQEDGTVDWQTYSGFRRYHSECHVCHGPDGEGSTYAPALKESAVRMDYYDFYGVIAEGRKKVNASENQVMPAFGVNPNVMCFVDDIYVYLKARGAELIPRGRPAKKMRKTDSIAEEDNACMG